VCCPFSIAGMQGSTSHKSPVLRPGISIQTRRYISCPMFPRKEKPRKAIFSKRTYVQLKHEAGNACDGGARGYANAKQLAGGCNSCQLGSIIPMRFHALAVLSDGLRPPTQDLRSDTLASRRVQKWPQRPARERFSMASAQRKRRGRTNYSPKTT
jgi:hypothetical protein